MTEQKRRGRPPKVDAEKLKQDIPTLLSVVKVSGCDADTQAVAVSCIAQAYADRVWAGQSPSALRSWRIERVKAALEGQNLPFDGVELPE